MKTEGYIDVIKWRYFWKKIGDRVKVVKRQRI